MLKNINFVSKFRKAKVRERQLLKACRENNRGERTQEFKAQLRQKFLDKILLHELQ